MMSLSYRDIDTITASLVVVWLNLSAMVFNNEVTLESPWLGGAIITSNGSGHCWGKKQQVVMCNSISCIQDRILIYSIKGTVSLSRPSGKHWLYASLLWSINPCWLKAPQKEHSSSQQSSVYANLFFFFSK